MSRNRQLFYGWYDARQDVYRVSAYPPDSPRRPSLALPSAADVMALIERKRARIMWWPPLAEGALRALG